MSVLIDQVSVNISRRVYERVSQWAQKRKLDVDQVIEEAIEGVVLADAQVEDAAWDQIMQAIEYHQVATGIPDLADEHDHYLYGKSKRNSHVE